LKNQNIIVVGQQAWDTEIGSNCKNIALEFAKQNKVLYINFPLDRITKFRGKNDPKIQKRLKVIAGKESGLVQIANNLYQLYPNCLIESINWISSDYIFKWLNKLNNKKLAKAIAPALKELNFSDFILFNDSDMFRSFHLKELLKPKLSIYYSRDNMLATSYYKRHGQILEPQIIAQSDLCVANSAYLKNYCKQYNVNSYDVGQGCDFTIFNNPDIEEVSAALKQLKVPIIGYVGVLTSARLDIDLIYYIAKNRADWNIVLVGPEDDAFKNSALHKLANVHFLGPQPTDDLPKYINFFDVCFNPQLLNELTIGNYPRKIDEYLALGKPTIATKTETMDVFKNHVYLANNGEEYIEGIESLLKNNTEDLMIERKNFALSHTWENSVAAIYWAINHSKN
jgi:teichuronic acid biosynthesis glycosyltransferase TuaH